jgi:hypothetical protein
MEVKLRGVKALSWVVVAGSSEVDISGTENRAPIPASGEKSHYGNIF